MSTEQDLRRVRDAMHRAFIVWAILAGVAAWALVAGLRWLAEEAP